MLYYSEIIELLRHSSSLKKDSLNWTLDCDNAISILKQRPMSSPVLTNFLTTPKPILTSGASAKFIVICFSLIIDRCEQPHFFIRECYLGRAALLGY